VTSRHPAFVGVCISGAVSTLSLLASGLWLTFNYRPRSGWQSAPVEAGRVPFGPTDTSAGWIGEVHRLSAVALVLVLLVAAGWALIASAHRGRLDLAVVGGIAVGATAVAIAYRTGGFLPYELLALWAVRASPSYEGVWTIAWDDTVRFIFNGRETTPAEYQLRLVIHLIAAPAILLAAVGTVAARARRQLGP
jgi:quinol-cytochrome oxidoreductase complex cytochrome b subunit